MNFISYVTYLKATGKILQRVNSLEVDVSRHVNDIVGVFMGDALGDGYIQADTFVAMPQRPSEHHVFDYVEKCWTDPRSLIDHKDAQWDVIKAARTNALTSVFAWDGDVFDCHVEAKIDIRAAADRARRDSTSVQSWRLANNSKRTLNAAELAALGDALDVHVATQHAKASVLRDQIYAATTVAEVIVINWF